MAISCASARRHSGGDVGAVVSRAEALKAPASKFSAALVGDSLLAGLVERNSYEPVRDAVAARLAPRIYSPVDVAASAVPLASVGDVEARLRRAVAAAPPPDAVVVLGGTNDLWRRDAAAVAASLARQYDAARAAGVRFVVGCTLPPFTPGVVTALPGLRDGVEATRLAVNDAIRDAAPVLVDLARACDADAATYARPDGIHFTRAGYRALGAAIGDALETALRDGTRKGVVVVPRGR